MNLPVRDGFELFLISFLILFLELRAIRGFPAHALSLTFFPNVVLLASSRGMSVGCLAASHRRNYLRWTPLILVVGMATAHIVEITSGQFVQNGIDRPSPEVVLFGNAYRMPDLFRYPVPVEVMGGFFFVVIALSFIGMGRELGRALNRWPNSVQTYTSNITGSIVRIDLFRACS